MDRRNQENARWLCRLIEQDRQETTAYVAKWATVVGNRVCIICELQLCFCLIHNYFNL